MPGEIYSCIACGKSYDVSFEVHRCEPTPNMNFENDHPPLTKGDKHLEICKRLNQVYRQKNADYGDSYGIQFEEHGPVAGILYIENKLRRIKQLMKNPAQVKGESMKDSIDDLINYSIMFGIEMEDK
jgi:hypothetical protein